MNKMLRTCFDRLCFLKLLVILFSMAVSAPSFSQDDEVGRGVLAILPLVADEESSILEKIEDVQKENERISYILLDVQGNVESSLRDNDKVEVELSELRAQLLEYKNRVLESSQISKVGAAILLIGLSIEVIGATVLAGTHLVVEQKDVYTLSSTPPLRDMGITDVNSKPRIDFLGAVASLMLFLGFVLQFSGTVMVLSLPVAANFLLILLAIVPSSIVIYYLLGQSYEQSRREKIMVICGNVKRNFISFSRNKCFICSKPVREVSDAKVYWKQEKNSDSHPFLHTPRDMHFGHEKCLESSGIYEDTSSGFSIGRDYFYRKDVVDFVENDVPVFEDWWKRYRKHWEEKSGGRERVCFSEYSYGKVRDKANCFLKGKR